MELFSIYSNILEELTNREVITTKNLVGEMAEYLVIEHYKNNSSLPNLLMDSVTSVPLGPRI